MNHLSYQIKNLSYSAGHKKILNDINLNIEAGKVTAILGPNGSGKSTLLKLLSGLISPSEGDILVHDKPLALLKRKELAKQLTMLPQHSPVPLGMTIEDLVACGRAPYAGPFGRLGREDHAAIHRALDRVHMQDNKKQVVDHLSGGEMQRVWLAMVLAQETGILLLDEPTSWLDVAHQLRLLKIIKTLNNEKQVTVVWILHDLNQALQYSDQIILLHQGEVLAHGDAGQVISQKAIADLFGIQTEAVTLNSRQQTFFIPVSEAVTARNNAFSTHIAEEVS